MKNQVNSMQANRLRIAEETEARIMKLLPLTAPDETADAVG